MGVATEDHVLERARTLAKDFATRAGQHDHDGSFPFENFEALRDAGMLNLTVPEQYGGMGTGLTLTCRVLQELAGGDASTALVLAMHYIYHGIFRRGGERWPAGTYERLARESVAGLALINVMRVEPELGTPVRGGLPATTAYRTATGWRLSGHKLYATGAPLVRYAIVYARTEGDDPSVGNFLVPMAAPGVRIVETWDHLGMRATGSHDMIMEDVELEGQAALDLRPAGVVIPPDPSLAGWNAMSLTALYHGIACAARDWLTGYLHERRPSNLGASLATLPRFQIAVGEIQALLYATEQLLYGTTEDIDAGRVSNALMGHASLVKYTGTNNAVRVCDIAMGLTGNPGLSRSHPLERFHRDVLCSRIHSPQDDQILLNAGKSRLGLS